MAGSRVKDGDIVVGKPMPWPVYDENGLLLLKKGYVIHSEQQLELLMSRGMYTSGGGAEEAKSRDQQEVNPFTQLGNFSFRIQQLFGGFHKRNPKIAGTLLRLRQDIQLLCTLDTDALVGAVHLWQDTEPALNLTLDTTLLCVQMALRCKLSAEQNNELVNAALLNNIADKNIIAIIKAAPLEVQNSEDASLYLAKQCELEETECFDIVRQHHQQLAGGIALDDVSPSAQILTLCFFYASLLQTSKRKGANGAILALPKLLPLKDKLFEERILAEFVHLLGSYPCGSFVRLINNETAVVIHQGKQKKSPKVATIINSKGAPCVTPMRRDCAQPDYSVKEPVHPAKQVSLNLALLWGYK